MTIKSYLTILPCVCGVYVHVYVYAHVYVFMSVCVYACAWANMSMAIIFANKNAIPTLSLQHQVRIVQHLRCKFKSNAWSNNQIRDPTISSIHSLRDHRYQSPVCKLS